MMPQATLFTPDAPTVTMRLRPYQEEGIQSIQNAWKTPPHRALIQLATGLGKTVLFSELAHRANVPTLILAHREELLTQARDKMRSVWPEADIGILSGKLNLEELGHQITIAGVQTIVKPKRLKAVAGDLSSGGIVIVDECHHSTANTYKTILAEFQNVCLLGVTATIDRGDGDNITEIFGEPIFQRGLLWGMTEIDNDPESPTFGKTYLARLRARQVKTTTNLDRVHTRMGDFAEDELARAINTPARNADVVKGYLEYAKGRQAICFSANVAHAHALQRAFADAGVSSAVVSGETPGFLRRAILSDYATGVIQVVCNCGVLTEGFDAPETAAIIMARPTRSRPLFVQMAGRGTRQAPCKDDCILLDITDNCHTHDLLTASTALELPPDDEIEKQHKGGITAGDEAHESGGGGRQKPKAKLSNQSYEHDLLPEWEKAAQGRYKMVLKNRAQVWLAPREDGYIVGLVWPDGRKQEVLSRPMAIDWAMNIGAKHAKMIVEGNGKLIDKDAPWRREPASPTQLDKLARWHVAIPPNCTKGEASDLMDAKIAYWAQRRARKAQGGQQP
jgi:superfamily II DNA or RNA helicase